MFIYYCILIRIVKAVGTYFFVRALFTSFLTHFSLLTFFCYFVLFHSCGSHARVFGKTLVHEFPIAFSHAERYLVFFIQCNYKCTMCIRSEKVEILVCTTSKPIPLD